MTNIPDFVNTDSNVDFAKEYKRIKNEIADPITRKDALQEALSYFEKGADIFMLFLEAYDGQDMEMRDLASEVLSEDTVLDWEVVRRIKKNQKPILPIVGMGATISVGSDAYAYTVISVSPTQKTCILQEDIAKRIDTNGQSETQEYEYTCNPNGKEKTARLTKYGWVSEGHKVTLNLRSAYRDPSF